MRVRIESRENEIAVLRARLTKITATLKNDRVQETMGEDRMADAVIYILEQEKILADEIKELARLSRDMILMLDKMSTPEYAKLLRLRYLDDELWEDIADEMRYSWRHTMRMHGYALTELQAVLDEMQT